MKPNLTQPNHSVPYALHAMHLIIDQTLLPRPIGHFRLSSFRTPVIQTNIAQFCTVLFSSAQLQFHGQDPPPKVYGRRLQVNNGDLKLHLCFRQLEINKKHGKRLSVFQLRKMNLNCALNQTFDGHLCLNTLQIATAWKYLNY